MGRSPFGKRPIDARSSLSGHTERQRSHRTSATQPEARDQRAVPLDVDALEVTEQTTTLADQQEQPTTRVVVVLVKLQVLSEVEDARGEHGDLNLGRPGVTWVGGVFVDDGFLGIWR